MEATRDPRWRSTPVLLPGKSHGQRSLVGCSSWDHEESDTTERLHVHFSLSCIGEGNSNPFQCSCLENPRGGGAWWAAVCGVAQSDMTEVTKQQQQQQQQDILGVLPWKHKLFCHWLFSVTGLVFVSGQSAAAAAKSLQLCPTLCDPIDGSPPGSPVSGFLQAKTLEWVAISFSHA